MDSAANSETKFEPHPLALARGCRIVALTTGIAMLLGGALLMTIDPHQEVGAKLLVEPRSTALDAKSSSAREKEFLPTQAEVIASPTVITNAVRQTAPDLQEAEIPARVGAVAGQLKVDPLAGTNILLVRYTDSTAQRAADLVNALIESYRKYLAATELQHQQEMLTALRAREREHQTSMQALQTEYEQLAMTRANSAATDADASARILAGIEESIAKAQSRLALLERAAEQFTASGRTRLTMTKLPSSLEGDPRLATAFDPGARNDDPKPALRDLQALSSEPWIGIPNPAELEAKKTDAQRRVSELSVLLGPQHPELVAAQTAVTRYEQELQQLVQTAPARVQLALENVRTEVESLQQRFESQLQISKDAEMMHQQEVRKLEEIDRARQAGETLQVQLQQWQSADPASFSGRAGISVTVLEPPVASARSFAANPLIVVGITGLLGLLFGVALLVILPQISALIPALNKFVAVPSSDSLSARDVRL